MTDYRPQDIPPTMLIGTHWRRIDDDGIEHLFRIVRVFDRQGGAARRMADCLCLNCGHEFVSSLRFVLLGRALCISCRGGVGFHAA